MKTGCSVIIPIFNNSIHIEECISSIICQISEIDQIILVDDCSTEKEVGKILSKYIGNEKISIYSNERNIGISATQNFALSKVMFSHVAFIDCDDYVHNNAFSIIRKFQADYPTVDYLYTQRFDMYESKIELYDQTQKISGHQYGISDLLLDDMVASHLKVIKTSALKKINGFSSEFDGVQDLDVALKISEFGKIEYLNKPLYFHRIHDNQISNKNRSNIYRKTNIVKRNALRRRDLLVPRDIPSDDAKFISQIGKEINLLNLKNLKIPSGGLILTFEANRMRLISIFEYEILNSISDNSICFFFPDTIETVGLIRHTGLLKRCYVGLVVWDNQQSIGAAQWANGFFHFLMFLDEMSITLMSGYLADDVMPLYCDNADENDV